MGADLHRPQHNKARQGDLRSPVSNPLAVHTLSGRAPRRARSARATDARPIGRRPLTPRSWALGRFDRAGPWMRRPAGRRPLTPRSWALGGLDPPGPWTRRPAGRRAVSVVSRPLGRLRSITPQSTAPAQAKGRQRRVLAAGPASIHHAPCQAPAGRRAVRSQCYITVLHHDRRHASMYLHISAFMPGNAHNSWAYK